MGYYNAVCDYITAVNRCQAIFFDFFTIKKEKTFCVYNKPQKVLYAYAVA